MNKPRLLALLGAIIVSIGVFLPVISYPSGDLRYFDTAVTESYAVLGLAALAVILALANRTKFIWISGIGAMAALVYSFFRMQKSISTLVSQSSDSLASLGQTEGSIGFQWGWGVLLLGTILLIAAGATGDDE